MLRVSTNMSAVNAMKNLAGNNKFLSDAFQKAASGSRINKAADDAAGLAISENLKAQIRSNKQALRNANDGISLVQTAEGGLNELSGLTIRLRELAIQASSDTVGDRERGYIDLEVQQLKEEMDRIANATRWGSQRLLDGSTPVFDFQVGLNNDPSVDRISFDSSSNVATLDALGLSSLDFTNKESAADSLQNLDDAQNRINEIRAGLGALQNRLVSTSNNIEVLTENITAANSRVRDADMAEVSADLAKGQILMQANVATLAQANQKNALALQLLG